jgi:hypothetical protein
MNTFDHMVTPVPAKAISDIPYHRPPENCGELSGIGAIAFPELRNVPHRTCDRSPLPTPRNGSEWLQRVFLRPQNEFVRLLRQSRCHQWLPIAGSPQPHRRMGDAYRLN